MKRSDIQLGRYASTTSNDVFGYRRPLIVEVLDTRPRIEQVEDKEDAR